MTTSGQQGGGGGQLGQQIIQQQQPTTTTQVVIQQQVPGTAGQLAQSQAIRKVGSSGNLLQQKVQVINRPNIQIVQTPAQRLGKPATSTTMITTLPLSAGGASTSGQPIQFQQVFQQQQSQQQQQLAKIQTGTGVSQPSK